MVKRSKRVVKRVYERGREITLPYARKPSVPAQPKPVRPAIKTATVPIQKPIESKRQYLHPAQPSTLIKPQAPWVENYELFPRYGTTRLTLIVKDPFWIYAYWEIAHDSLEQLRRRIGQETLAWAKVVLRMYDVSLIDFNGHNAHSFFDLEVGPQIDNWYISLWQDNLSYVGEIGLRTPGGEFFALARSNAAHTPRAGYSARSEQIWMEVKDDGEATAYVIPHFRPKKDLVQSKLTQPGVSKEKKDIYYLSEEDIRSYYARLGSLLREIIGKKKRGVFLLEGESAEERSEILARLPREYFLRKLIVGASESIFIGASEQIPPGASDFVQQKIKRQFFFEVNTELIVHGRTEPNAQLWLGNKQILLRADGTFSLRFALGDGKIPLDFTAVSGDKQEKRKINIDVQRKTDYPQ